MEFKKGDLVIATSLPYEINSFVNGDILQIIEKRGRDSYAVKVIYKEDHEKWNMVYHWSLYDECQYFELFE